MDLMYLDRFRTLNISYENLSCEEKYILASLKKVTFNGNPVTKFHPKMCPVADIERAVSINYGSTDESSIGHVYKNELGYFLVDCDGYAYKMDGCVVKEFYPDNILKKPTKSVGSAHEISIQCLYNLGFCFGCLTEAYRWALAQFKKDAIRVNDGKVAWDGVSFIDGNFYTLRPYQWSSI